MTTKNYSTDRNNVPYYEFGKPVVCKRADGITISVRIKDDEYPMGAEDYLGKITDSPRSGEWKHAVKIERDNVPNSWEDDPNSCYFIPNNPFADRRAWYAKHGYSRHEAYTKARQELMEDYDLLCKFYDGDQYGEMIIEVTVKYNGLELGSASCGGVLSGRDSDDSQAIFEETAFDLTCEAVDEAINQLERVGGNSVPLAKLSKAYGRLAKRRYDAQRKQIKIQRVQAWRGGKCPACGGSKHAPFSANERKLGALVGFRGERQVDHGAWVTCPHCEGRPDYMELKGE